MKIQTKLLERLRSAYSNATSCELRFDCCWSCSSWEMEEEEDEGWALEENGREEERGRNGESGNIGVESELPMPYNFFQQQPIHSSLCFNTSLKL